MATATLSVSWSRWFSCDGLDGHSLTTSSDRPAKKSQNSERAKFGTQPCRPADPCRLWLGRVAKPDRRDTSGARSREKPRRNTQTGQRACVWLADGRGQLSGRLGSGRLYLHGETRAGDMAAD